jgi:gluconolactonase
LRIAILIDEMNAPFRHPRFANWRRETAVWILLPSVVLFIFLGSGFDSARAQDRALDDVLLRGSDWELVADGFKFLEGPAVDTNGVLYFSDIPTSKIYRLNAEGQPEVFVQNSDVTNGLMFGPDGRLYGCQIGKRRVVAFDKQGQPHEILKGIAANDLVITRDGGIYLTDPENKLVIYISPSGEDKVVDRGIGRPNGVALWPGHGTLAVSDTLGEHVWVFQIQSDGSLAHKEGFYRMFVPPDRSASGADGMTVDTRNRLYVATYAGIQVFDSQGRLIGIIAKPQNAFLSNIKFGGPKFDTLYATSTDKLYRRRMKATGAR